MDYETFSQVWDEEIARSGLSKRSQVHETLDVRSLERAREIFVEPPGRRRDEPFYVSAALRFRWGALDTARSEMREEDVLSWLFDRERAAKQRTSARLIRVEVEIAGGLTNGITMPMPAPAAWRYWVTQLDQKLEPIFPRAKVKPSKKGPDMVEGWRSSPELVLECASDGALGLQRLSVSMGQLLKIPRHWDDPDRRQDPSPRPALKATFAAVGETLDVWGKLLAQLKSGRTSKAGPRPTAH